MNKLITSLACTTVLSMSLLGVGSAAHAAGTGGGMGSAVPDTGATGMNTERTHMLNGTGNGTGNGNGTGTGIGTRVNNMMDRTTGTVNRTTDNILGGDRNNRTGDNHGVSPLSNNNNNNNNNGRYRATAANNNNDDGMDWGWLGLIGLLGLAGMRNKSSERERR
ncbi:hypothetical protein C2I18_04245 [Paenibacillus sp. PK3_47]|uniref:WGxxGxxG family protein n=1 Tax=Paenibacillus sp. PK3_47 TaxID=2072642 RepID=UPI00201DD507|nr:WGxxGxxG family protein [Paenibacillus sp. PK3_47]UQZ32838.1 hypothetical protein C2I18_04245 [Paenibacillus sp. PK3_47]